MAQAWTAGTRRTVIAGVAGMLAVSVAAGGVLAPAATGDDAVILPVAEPALARAVSAAEAEHTAAVAAARVAAEEEAAAAAAERAAQAGRQQSVVDRARAKVGSAYRMGAAGPSAFDCSGFVMWVYQQGGVSLPHNTRAQWNAADTWYVGEREPRAGDIVFFFNGADHVGIYVGNGKMVHAANPRAGVTVDSIHDGYWGSRLTGFGRVLR